MKKFLILLGVLLLAFIGYLVYDSTYEFTKKIPVLEIQEEIVNIDEIYIYGTHLNIVGNHLFEDEADLVLYNGEFIIYDINYSDEKNAEYNLFNISNLVNDGIYLDEIPSGKYYLFLRTEDTDKQTEQSDENEEKAWKYYALKNNTDYQETTYYSMNNYEKKIVIENEDSYPTMMINVKKVKNDEVYDIVIDPGHGGRDGGATKYGYKETDFTLDIANEVRNSLEEVGMKVKLTHEIGQLSNTEKLNEYGINGRAVIPREVNAKYLFSFHFNSSPYTYINGLEIYTAKNINYDFAKLLVSNLTSKTGIKLSTNKINKMHDGIYTRNFTEDDIKQSLREYAAENLKAYDITTNSTYYYIIRETGGIITGAYVDNRNDDVFYNPYVKSNIGTEAYLLELGYISNRNDVNNVVNNKDKFVEAIVDSILTLYSAEEEKVENKD